jgi:hypothetical protein
MCGFDFGMARSLSLFWSWAICTPISLSLTHHKNLCFFSCLLPHSLFLSCSSLSNSLVLLYSSTWDQKVMFAVIQGGKSQHERLRSVQETLKRSPSGHILHVIYIFFLTNSINHIFLSCVMFDVDGISSINDLIQIRDHRFCIGWIWSGWTSKG